MILPLTFKKNHFVVCMKVAKLTLLLQWARTFVLESKYSVEVKLKNWCVR